MDVTTELPHGPVKPRGGRLNTFAITERESEGEIGRDRGGEIEKGRERYRETERER